MSSLFVILLSLLSSAFARTQTSPTIELRNGNWLSGNSFVAGTRYIVNGKLSGRTPEHVDSVIDLHSGYVIPPFGEAHNHNVDYSNLENTRKLLNQYLKDGVFYVMNPGSVPRGRDSLNAHHLVNHAQSVDVLFSLGLLTATGGHPSGLWKRNVARGGMTLEDGDGGFIWLIDTRADLDAKWPRILAGKPDFIKTILVHSEEYERRRQDTAYFNWRGLNPALLPEIVRRAHAAGLRVATHVETAADFHNALAARVDVIAHTPGFRGNESAHIPDPKIFEVSAADARRAAKQGTVVATTLSGATTYKVGTPDRQAFDDLAKKNLRTLLAAHVHLALGSDTYRDDSSAEGAYLATLGVLTNMELVRLWSVATPRAIFPKRKVGCLDDGCDASFLVLGADPAISFDAVHDIRLRVKDGKVLPAMP